MQENQRSQFEKLFRELMGDAFSCSSWVIRGDERSVDQFLDVNEAAREKEGEPWPAGFRAWARENLITG